MIPSRSATCSMSVLRRVTSYSHLPKSPLLLASVGAGITTVLPIVEQIARTQPQRTVIVAHADGRAADHALRDTVLHLGREIDNFSSYTWYEILDEGDTRSRQGYMDLSSIQLPDDIQVFTCGPLPFMRHVRSTLLDRGVPPARIRYEVFGPDVWAAQRLLAQSDVDRSALRLDQSTAVVERVRLDP
jgi:nitric oxide dioxygenase